MTYNPNHDRDYWRAVSTRTLIEAARDSGHELAIALGERLEELTDCADEMEDAQTEARYLQERCDRLHKELEATQAALDAEGPDPALLDALEIAQGYFDGFGTTKRAKLAVSTALAFVKGRRA